MDARRSVRRWTLLYGRYGLQIWIVSGVVHVS
jgi:hypothetical protein